MVARTCKADHFVDNAQGCGYVKQGCCRLEKIFDVFDGAVILDTRKRSIVGHRCLMAAHLRGAGKRYLLLEL